MGLLDSLNAEVQAKKHYEHFRVNLRTLSYNKSIRKLKLIPLNHAAIEIELYLIIR